MPPHPGNLYLQIGNPAVKLRHRQRIEILPGKLRHRIIGTTRKILLGIHVPER